MADLRKSPPDLLNELATSCPEEVLAGCRLEVALSGGLDSMVLLDLLWRLSRERHFLVSAVHVHHGLSPNADDWARHCERCCAQYAVELTVARVTVEVSGGESLEAVARSRRYAVYRASSADVVVLAHHQDDQAETVMLQLLRGGGPHALAAMPAWRELGAKRLWRPLLSCSRTELEAYARERGLAWVNDESNEDRRWRRNFLRHELMPLLAQTLPDYRQHISRTAQLMAQAAQVLDEVAEQDLQTCVVAGRLDLRCFARYSSARQHFMLVRWLKQLQAGEVSPGAIDDFCWQLLHARADRQPELRLESVLLYRYRQQVWVEYLPVAPLPMRQLFDGLAVVDGACLLTGGSLAGSCRAAGLAPELLCAGVWLGRRVGGERLLLEVGHKTVKSLLQEAGIPPRLRARWPLLYLADGRLAAIPSVAVALDCRAQSGVWLDWYPQ